MKSDPYLPHEVEVIERLQETEDIFTLQLAFTNEKKQRNYNFEPGQFNMLYCYGVGEVPISIVSNAEERNVYTHTLRKVGRVTTALSLLQKGDKLGLRGPFGKGWPLQAAIGKHIILVTGGIGCAPVISMMHYILKHRTQFGSLTIMQGVKQSNDLIYRKYYEYWSTLPDTHVYVAADQSDQNWLWHTGSIIQLLDSIEVTEPQSTIAMLCGPEGMMAVSIQSLIKKQVPEHAIYLSMERNMECAIGHCGHCQYGGKFICKDGPVFCYPDIKDLFTIKGF